jgi:hypothetical protein
MVHLLLVASLMTFVAWFVGMVGGFSKHTAWIFLVVSWWFGMAWSYAWFYQRWRRDQNRRNPSRA